MVKKAGVKLSTAIVNHCRQGLLKTCRCDV